MKNSSIPVQTEASFVITPSFKGLARLFIAAIFLACFAARAQTADDQYLAIFNLLQDADSLSALGQSDAAIVKYRQAQTEFLNYKQNHPDANAKAVSYRLAYVGDKLAVGAKAAQAAASPAGTGAPGAASSSSVKLSEAGSEPRTVLRLHPTAGDKQTMELNIKMAMDTKLGEMQSPPMNFPAFKMNMDLTVNNVAPDGQVTYDITLADVSIADDANTMPQIAEALKSAIGGIKGLTGSGTMSSRGIIKNMDMKLPADANAQTKQAMEQMKESFSRIALPLPEEAVGAGAKWQVKTPTKSQGMNIEQIADYDLVSVEGDHVTAKLKMAQTAGNQKVANPAMPNIKLDLNKMNGEGTGDISVDLTHLMPLQGSLDYHSQSDMTMNMGGQKQPMNMKMDMNVQFESK